MSSSTWNSTLAISGSMHILSPFFFFFCIEFDIRNVKFHLKICIEFDTSNIEFQKKLYINNIKFQSIDIILFGYIVQKLRLHTYFSVKDYMLRISIIMGAVIPLIIDPIINDKASG